MTRFRWLNKKFVVAVLGLVLLLLGGGILWTQRTPLLSWYYVRNLASADESNQSVWVERVAVLGEAAVPGLLERLTDPNPAVCRNLRAALAKLVQQWGTGDARTTALAIRCGRDFKHFSGQGQQNILELAADWFRDTKSDSPLAQGLVPACVRFLTETTASSNTDTQDRALELCAVLLAHPHGAEALGGCRELVRHCLSSESTANRVRAVQLAVRRGMDLHEPVTALLSDPAVEVRRAAIDSVGLAEDVVLDDVLLPSLHDPDPEVRHLCYDALESRGRTPVQIRLGYLLTAPNPAVRIQVIDHLPRVAELDPTVWLTRISRDPSPAIRAAAARSMSRLKMAERLDEMARTDPSATVCTIARYYLDHLEREE